ncbi:MAG: response regulator [Syntrophobacter sp.]
MEREPNTAILIVDDEKAMCRMLQQYLRRQGYGCHCETDPCKALRMLDRKYFDLVVSDIKMPDLNGMDLLRQILGKHPGTSIIIMTGYANEFSYSEIIQAGAMDFIRKPIELSELKAKIERIQREQRMLRDLQETNNALGVVLKRVEGDKERLCADILANLKELVFPYLDKLARTRLDERQKTYVDILNVNLSKLTSPFLGSLARTHANLSHMEIRIADLIQAGKDNKEIADTLGVSINTVKTHRYHLRTKLGLGGMKVNLRSYLKSISF